MKTYSFRIVVEGDRSYAHTTNGHHIAHCWTIRIALSENEYLNLVRGWLVI